MSCHETKHCNVDLVDLVDLAQSNMVLMFDSLFVFCYHLVQNIIEIQPCILKKKQMCIQYIKLYSIKQCT